MAKLNSQKLLDASKANDNALVAWLQQHGKKCEVVDELADMFGKYDIVVESSKYGTMYIDTKYTTRQASHLFYEVEKHKNSKANWIWYFLKNNNMVSFLIRKDVLKKLAANRECYQAKANGDKLIDFDVNELECNVDFWQISSASNAFM